MGYKRIYERSQTLALFEWTDWIDVEYTNIIEPPVSHDEWSSLNY